MSIFQDINNFENLAEISGRNFNDLKAKLLQIGVPTKIIQITKEPTGKFSAVVFMDRPARKAKKES